jgi:hypothetical protein
MAIGCALVVRKRVLIAPRGLVNLRNGAETALSGIALCEILWDNRVRVVTLLASRTIRDCAATSFSSASSRID